MHLSRFARKLKGYISIRAFLELKGDPNIVFRIRIDAK